MRKYLFTFLATTATLCTTAQLHGENHQKNTEYQFYGRHLIVSFKDCDFDALDNAEELRTTFMKAIEASGATCLGTCGHKFQPHGYTMIALLSESHASIHTYPEVGSCFIDVFTCGTQCKNEEFITLLADYLKPGTIEQSSIERK